jgi:hypothetical protein
MVCTSFPRNEKKIVINPIKIKIIPIFAALNNKTRRMEEKKDNKKTVEDFIRENPTIVETLRDAAKVCEAHSHSFIGGALRRYADRLREIEDNMEVRL